MTKQFIYDVSFVVTFHSQIEADSEEEARKLLEAVSIDDVMSDPDWSCDPHEFQKTIDGRDENPEELFACVRCGAEFPEDKLTSCYGCYAQGTDDTYCLMCLEAHLAETPVCARIYEEA